MEIGFLSSRVCTSQRTRLRTTWAHMHVVGVGGGWWVVEEQRGFKNQTSRAYYWKATFTLDSLFRTVLSSHRDFMTGSQVSTFANVCRWDFISINISKILKCLPSPGRPTQNKVDESSAVSYLSWDRSAVCIGPPRRGCWDNGAPSCLMRCRKRTEEKGILRRAIMLEEKVPRVENERALLHGRTGEIRLSWAWLSLLIDPPASWTYPDQVLV